MSMYKYMYNTCTFPLFRTVAISKLSSSIFTKSLQVSQPQILCIAVSLNQECVRLVSSVSILMYLFSSIGRSVLACENYLVGQFTMKVLEEKIQRQTFSLMKTQRSHGVWMSLTNAGVIFLLHVEVGQDLSKR